HNSGSTTSLVRCGGGLPVCRDPRRRESGWVDRDLGKLSVREEAIGPTADVERIAILRRGHHGRECTVQFAVDIELGGDPVVRRSYVVPAVPLQCRDEEKERINVSGHAKLKPAVVVVVQ